MLGASSAVMAGISPGMTKREHGMIPRRLFRRSRRQDRGHRYASRDDRTPGYRRRHRVHGRCASRAARPRLVSRSLSPRRRAMAVARSHPLRRTTSSPRGCIIRWSRPMRWSPTARRGLARTGFPRARDLRDRDVRRHRKTRRHGAGHWLMQHALESLMVAADRAPLAAHLHLRPSGRAAVLSARRLPPIPAADRDLRRPAPQRHHTARRGEACACH